MLCNATPLTLLYEKDMTLKQLLSMHKFPMLAEYAERLQLRMDQPICMEQAEAKKLYDELKHLAVMAFNPTEVPR